MKVEKVHLETLMKALMMMFNQGIDYVDIEHKDDVNGEPSIFLSYKDEYVSEDEEDIPSEESPTAPPSIDFNDLV
jgi:hypothetical protein